MERTRQPEWLAVADPADAARNLADLRRINRWLGGWRIARKLVAQECGRAETFSLLDVGAASGDVGAVIERDFPHACVVALDCRERHLDGAGRRRVAADAFHLPFPSASFDLVLCSLFLHHFDEGEIVALLSAFARVARRAVIAIDLERDRLAYRFLPATRPLFGWHPITVHDGPASVAAGFRTEELRALAGLAGLAGARVRHHRPWFRLSLVARRML